MQKLCAAGIKIPIPYYYQPPKGIGRHIVHPAGQRCGFLNVFKRFFHQRYAAEDRAHRKHFGVHIPHPYKAVALDSVPYVILQAKPAGVRRSVINFVQRFIAAGEAPDIRNIAVNRNRRYRPYRKARSLAVQTQAYKTEARFVKGHITVGRKQSIGASHRMVVCGIFFSRSAQCLRYRFAAGYINACGLIGMR